MRLVNHTDWGDSMPYLGVMHFDRATFNDFRLTLHAFIVNLREMINDQAGDDSPLSIDYIGESYESNRFHELRSGLSADSFPFYEIPEGFQSLKARIRIPPLDQINAVNQVKEKYLLGRPEHILLPEEKKSLTLRVNEIVNAYKLTFGRRRDFDVIYSPEKVNGRIHLKESNQWQLNLFEPGYLSLYGSHFAVDQFRQSMDDIESLVDKKRRRYYKGLNTLVTVE